MVIDLNKSLNGSFFSASKNFFKSHLKVFSISKTRLEQKNLEASPQTPLAFEKARQNFYGKLRFPIANRSLLAEI